MSAADAQQVAALISNPAGDVGGNAPRPPEEPPVTDRGLLVMAERDGRAGITTWETLSDPHRRPGRRPLHTAERLSVDLSSIEVHRRRRA